jgi:NADPH:quinone reductase-like Zn-dependent oxidoreductase
MRALRFARQGSLEALELVDAPEPVPAPGEALVAVRAAGINPSDVKNVLGRMAQTTLPRIPGRDFAGVVVAGSAALLGAEVIGSGDGLGFTRDGSHAELLAVPEEALVRKPAELSFEHAAALGVPFLTAWSAMIDAAGIRRGETALILGINGAVGSAAGQIARWRGARVIGTLRLAAGAAPPVEPDTGLPADLLVDLSDQELVPSVLAATNGRGVDVVLDVVGGALFEPCLRCLAQHGRQVAIAATGDPRVTFNLADFYHRQAHLVGVDSLALTFADARDIFHQILPLFRDGTLHPPAVRPWPLDVALAAYRHVDRREEPAKIVLVP